MYYEDQAVNMYWGPRLSHWNLLRKSPFICFEYLLMLGFEL